MRQVVTLAGWLLCSTALAQTTAEPIPYAQDKPPGPALSPTEAIAKMRTPPDFAVKLFAAEPNLVNPVAMAFDERGRVWVAESLEYPRKSAGVGKDRIKILEDTNGDGVADKFTVFADGLNIPSGIALGFGGAYVANAPDILFLKDTDGDDVADRRETLVTGFGRNDTHELPSCLTWGPDGWLYGLNGVFNHSTVVHDGKTHKFNCALWRFHPKTHKFELFAEGTSNPWGLEYNRAGDFFVTACVIDHLWHLTESGYYHRQSGAYPPFTWKIESIVGHKHQKAAYCGLCQYDANVYPPEYRGQWFMGNIHGSCINVDAIERSGASYRASPRPDFIAANDAWFMPVVQKVGPDGCLWILDWYDRYHCYQDAGRDPAGIDRLRGRLYRITYRDTPMPQPFDLRKISDRELLKLLGNPNAFYRRWARQLLIEGGNSTAELQALALSAMTPEPQRTEALWTWLSAHPNDASLSSLAEDADPRLAAWGVRAIASHGTATKTALARAAAHPDPAVRVQALVGAGKSLSRVEAFEIGLAALAPPADASGLLPRLAFKYMEPALVESSERFARWLGDQQLDNREDLAQFVPRAVDRLLADPAGKKAAVAIAAPLLDGNHEKRNALAAECLEKLVEAALAGRLEGTALTALEPNLAKIAAGGAADPRRAAALAARILTASPAPTAIDDSARAALESATLASKKRGLLWRACLRMAPAAAVQWSLTTLESGRDSDEFALELLSALGGANDRVVADRIIAAFDKLRPSLRAQALDLLSSRPIWANPLLSALAAGKIPTAVVNVNQIRKMRDLPDPECKKKVAAIWGAIREGRNRQRERVVDHYEEVVAVKKGDVANGAKVYARVCGQCHQYRGQGYAVGPSLNENGRSSLQQLLSNVLDPNLVIGRDYQARVVATADGRVVTGLVQEDSPARVVLKVAGGKLETFERSNIESFRESKVSLMPEELEKQTTDQEFRDLIAYLMTP